MTATIERALESALPDRTVEEIEPQTTRPSNETARVTFVDAGPVYVKTTTDGSDRLVVETSAVRHAAEHCPIGTPPIVAADPTGDPAFLVTDPLPGTLFNDPWTGDGDRERLLGRLGAVVAGVHEASFDRPGRITGVGVDELELTDATWTETLCRTVEWRADNWFADRFSDMPGRVTAAIRAVEPTLEDTAPTLLHGDPSRINVHLDPDGLLDWERALVGDPAFDLVEAAFHHVGQPDVGDDEKEALREAFFDGYRDRAGQLPPGLDRYRDLYRAIAYLLVPQTFEDWSEDADRPNDELAAEIREEFDSRLSAVQGGGEQ